ncbi:MAG TPA: hypothetical protein VEW42_03160 [Candidatus Eisenbacteria bacterium]|nr:hypothetical protein [Candidatus Eisenbacteria bacterium]
MGIPIGETNRQNGDRAMTPATRQRWERLKLKAQGTLQSWAQTNPHHRHDFFADQQKVLRASDVLARLPENL